MCGIFMDREQLAERFAEAATDAALKMYAGL